MSHHAKVPYYARAPLGQDTSTAPAPTTTSSSALALSTPAGIAIRVASIGAMGALAYHGYRRTNSWGWALAWGIGGGLIWPVALAVALAQGFGKSASVSRNRGRRRRAR